MSTPAHLTIAGPSGRSIHRAPRRELSVPADCVASEQDGDRMNALRLMQRVLDIDVRASTELDLAALARPAYSMS